MKFVALSTTIFSLSAVTLFASTSTLIEHHDLPRSNQPGVTAAKGYGHQTGVVGSVPMLDSRAWVIHTADGHCFDPTNLPDSMKVEGLRINFSFKTAADWGYIYSCGELIELTQVSRAK